MHSFIACTGVSMQVVCAAAAAPEHVRFATFNVSMYRSGPGELVEQLRRDDIYQFQQVAHVIQHVSPDVLTLNEFDYDSTGEAARLFRENYLHRPQSTPWTGATDAIHYPYAYWAPSNTGVASGHDFNNNGTTTDPEDAFGYGQHPGQYGMLVLSRFPIATSDVRTFQLFRWKDMPANLRPEWPQNPSEPWWYSDAEWDDFRLSSKSHWDVPIEITGGRVHILLSHPTPPVFDDVAGDDPTNPVDYNGRRNSDEIRFWRDYITPNAADYIYDDSGEHGGLPQDSSFIVMGDLNSDPLKGDSRPGSISQLLEHPRIQDTAPIGATFGTDTANFGLRADYVLPSSDLSVLGSGVFWPPFDGDPWLQVASHASDHRLVYVDVIVPEPSLVSSLTLLALALMTRRRCS